MNEKLPVSILIMTKNEELNLRQCLESVKWADEIVVVDSGSTDRTLEIANEHGCKIYRYLWDGKWPKKSWSLEAPRFQHDWILMLDADERATAGFKDELKTIVTDKANGFAGYAVRYHYWFLGKFIRFGDPVRKMALFRKSKSHFEKYDISGTEALENLEIGHEHPIIDGKIGSAKHALLHRDERSLYYYFDRHNRYSTWESELLLRGLYAESGVKSRRALKTIFLRLPFKPIIYFIYSYIFRLGFLDGYAGLCYNICKSIYAYQIGLKLYERNLTRKLQKR